MQDLVLVLVLLVIIGLAGRYVYKARKNGQKCIGCPAGCCCSKKMDGSPCSCGCGSQQADNN